MPFVTIARTVVPASTSDARRLIASSTHNLLEESGVHLRVFDDDGDIVTPDFAPGDIFFDSPTLLADGDVVAINNRVTRFHQGVQVDQSTFSPGFGRATELAGGNILVTYNDGGNLKGQLLSPTLDLVGTSFTIGAGLSYVSTVEALAGGGFVVLGKINLFGFVSIQAFDANGAPVGAPLSKPGLVYGEMESLPDGGFVFAGSRSSPAPAFAQIFNADGSARSAELPISGSPQGFEQVSVAVLDGDLFVVTHVVSNNTVAQLYHTSGHAIGDEFQISAGTTALAEGIDSNSFAAYGRVDLNSETKLIFWTVDRPNILLGNGTPESFDGAGVTDRIMVGFGGDDVYHVDSAGDIVHEWAGEGNDTVIASVSYQLRAGMEIELLKTSDDAGTTAINFIGNELAQTIRGNAGDNQLTSGGGIDTLIGLGGNDLYYIGNQGVVVQEAVGGGTDRVFASASYTLTAGAEVEMLTTNLNSGTAAINLIGNEFDQAIFGNEGANQLTGGGGADSLVGFGGDDFFFINDGREIIYESGGGGNDRIFTSVDYRLQAGVSVETITTNLDVGTAGIDIVGNELSQLIVGNAGDNQLTGGGGGDVLVGNGGNDWYFVGNASDIIVESAGGGTDRVFAGVSYTLSAGAAVEILSTDFNAGTAAINLTGNELANTIFGNAGDNILNGGAGADTLLGLAGNDWYFIDNAGDAVFEAAGQGNDRVFAGVSYTLTAGAEVEVMSTTDNLGTAAINLTGNELANTIFGNAGANILDGGAGKDVLFGGGGADVFLFSTALNTAAGTPFAGLAATANVDQINGFAFDDKIGLDASRFGMTPGALAASAFVTGTAALDADDRIIYDPTTGALLFDADGSGAGAAQLFAYLNGPFSLDASFFAVI